MLSPFRRTAPPGSPAAALEDAIHAQVDNVRARHGLVRLRLDPALARAARGHSSAMVEHGFFAHHSPLAGLAEPEDRARAEGARCEGIGENLAFVPQPATAERFVEMWMNSPGHRANILTAAWDVTGVGMFASGDGTVFATQLFGVAPRLVLDVVALRGCEPRWLLRVRMRIGVGHALAAFARSRLLGAVDADAQGEAVLQVEAASRAEEGRIVLSRRHVGGSDPWIDLHVVEIEDGPRGRPSLVPASPRPDSRFELLERCLVNAVATGSRLYLRGRTREPAILVVDQIVLQKIEPGAFEIEHPVESHGTLRVALGVPDTHFRYQVAREFDVSPAIGRLIEIG